MSRLLHSEYNLIHDAYLGNNELLLSKLRFLANMAQPEQWDYKGKSDKAILYNYLCFTYDRLLEEEKIAYSSDKNHMCFNTGLLNTHDADIYALFDVNTSRYKKDGQNWFLNGFRTATEQEMRCFVSLPEIADYFTNPGDFIFDKNLPLVINYDHIIDDNYERFLYVGLSDKYTIHALLESAVRRITEKVKRNYKLAIPQYYTDKTSGLSKIQLLLPLFLKQGNVADLALAVDRDQQGYIGKTILTLEMAYVNSRRIVRPEVDWLRI
ncbi:MAG: DUF3825 domain-containing protein [Saccharofermentans sp.]|nr:DUF3825 domain-containing protein [Saccharofermentans sp.]